jgi:hypothetical protein
MAATPSAGMTKRVLNDITDLLAGWGEFLYDNISYFIEPKIIDQDTATRHSGFTPKQGIIRLSMTATPLCPPEYQ